MSGKGKRRAAQHCSILSHLSARYDCQEVKFVQVGASFFEDEKVGFLKPQTKWLYLCMALVAGKDTEFFFSRGDALKFGIPDRTFRTAINELLEKGFLIRVESGKFTRTKNKFRFNYNWKNL